GLAFSPDGKVLAAADTDGSGGSIRFWDVAAGKELRRSRVERVAAFTVAFAPDGKTLAAAYGSDPLKAWDTEGKSYDSSDSAIALRDAVTGKELRLLRKDLILGRALAFSPDSKLLAARSGGAFRLLDVATGADVGRRPAHEGPVMSVAFSADGTS